MSITVILLLYGKHGPGDNLLAIILIASIKSNYQYYYQLLIAIYSFKIKQQKKTLLKYRSTQIQDF